MSGHISQDIRPLTSEPQSPVGWAAEPWLIAWAQPQPSARVTLTSNTVQVALAVRLAQPVTSALLDIAASRAGYFK